MPNGPADISRMMTVNPDALRGSTDRITREGLEHQSRLEDAFDATATLLGLTRTHGTPDMLIAMAQHELDSMDTQLETSLESINADADRVANLNRVLERLSAWVSTNNTHDRPVADSLSAHHTGGDGNGDDHFLNLGSRAEGLPANQATRPDGRDTTWADLLSDAGMNLDQFRTNGELAFNSRNIGELRAAIDARAKQLSQGSEVRQMQLQQLVTRRSQFTQLISQIMASINETTKSIVGNTRA